MATSKCPKCGNTSFEMKEHTPDKSNYKLEFVQCSSCGTVVGVMDYFNIGTRINEVDEKIDKLINLVNSINR